MTLWQAVIAALALIGVSLVLVRYFQERRALLARMTARTRVAQTTAGPIEYTSAGDGPTVLAVHGWGGGSGGDYDMFHFLTEQGFRVISPSRPGYMRTPLDVGQTMEAQADSFAALLDALDVPAAAVIAGSGGGPSSVLFALRHPDRCWGLVLVSAMTHPDATQVTQGQKALREFFKSDFFIWCVATLFWRQLVEEGMGGLSDHIRADRQTMADLRNLVHGLILSSHCKDGMANDWAQWERMPIYPLEKIATPALVIHARNDRTVLYPIAEFNATIPGAELLAFDDGGHTCFIAHAQVTHPAVAGFLARHAPRQP